jgi:hypothetical protein
MHASGIERIGRQRGANGFPPTARGTKRISI